MNSAFLHCCRSRFATLLLLGLVLLLRALHAAALEVPQLVSGRDEVIASPGGWGDSMQPIMSADGRFVVFASSANNLCRLRDGNLLPVDRAPKVNLFLRDRAEGVTTLISVNTNGTGGGNGNSWPKAISADGKMVLFESDADNLIPGDTNETTDVFLRNVTLGTTLLVSANTNGTVGNGRAHDAAMTPDGRRVAFLSDASDLAYDTNRTADAFVRDLGTGDLFMASKGRVTGVPRLSEDGTRLLFYSTNALNSRTPSSGDIYFTELNSGQPVLVSAGARPYIAQQGWYTNNVVCYGQTLSADGRYVVYAATVAGKTNGLLLRWEAVTQDTLLLATNASVAFGESSESHISAANRDASLVAYVAMTNYESLLGTAVVLWDASTSASKLLGANGAIPSFCGMPTFDANDHWVLFTSNGDPTGIGSRNGQWHLYRYDLQTEQTELVDRNGTAAFGRLSSAMEPSASADGHFVAFESGDSDLLTSDKNRNSDVFVRDMATGTIELVSTNSPGLIEATLKGTSELWPGAVAADGKLFVFTSDAAEFSLYDTNANFDVFIHDVEQSVTRMITVATNGAVANGLSTEPCVSANGRYVAFTSFADNLAPGDTNRALDVFVRDMERGVTAAVSVESSGSFTAAKDSRAPSISADGRYVTFVSAATNIDPPTTSGKENLFMRDLVLGRTDAITRNGFNYFSVAKDGRRVAFRVPVVPGSSFMSLFIWDALERTNIYSIQTGNVQSCALNADGTRLAFFAADATNRTLCISDLSDNPPTVLVSNLTAVLWDRLRISDNGGLVAYVMQVEGTNHLFAYDVATGVNRQVSRGMMSADKPEISPDGRFIAFHGSKNGLSRESAGPPDLFLFNKRSDSLIRLPDSTWRGEEPNNAALRPVFGPDSRVLFYQSWASNIVPGDGNGAADIFLCRLDGTPVLSIQGIGTGTAGSMHSVELVWPVQSGKSYRVEYKDGLADPTWRAVEGQIETEDGQGILRDTVAEGKRFYRLVAF